MAKFKKKPVIIEAIQFNGENDVRCVAFAHNKIQVMVEKTDGIEIKYLIIHTLEGQHRANINDWIIKGIKGEFYPCKPDIFAETYEPVIEQ